MSTFPQAQSHEPEGKSTFLQAHSSEPGGKLTFLRGHQRWDRVPSGNSELKCQHSQFTYSLLIKRNLPIFERVPLFLSGFEPGTSLIKGKRLTTWSTQASLKMYYSFTKSASSCLTSYKKILWGAHWNAKNYWNSPASLWNSTTVTTLLLVHSVNLDGARICL